MLTIKEFTDYIEEVGVESALDLLILGGPDNFEGDYELAIARLEMESMERIIERR